MHPNSTKEKDCFSVSEVNFLLNSALEQTFPRIKFEGEISEITFAKSGHLYFTLKDEKAALSAVMWKGSALGLRFKPAVGTKVLCEGRPNVYAATGRLQIIVQVMQPAGEGALQLKLQALYAKLEKEGLFEESRKRPIPKFPQNVGIVTSATGAVIHDITVRIQQRMPSIQLYLYDVRVQGEGSAKEIAEGIKFLNKFEPNPGQKLDVLIVGRGGGSLEDLWSFNEEEVVRAIFASSIPVISSVGHETDHCLSDLVADVRAPTPTAAAEMISMVKTDLLDIVDKLHARLQNFDRWLMPLAQKIDALDSRLSTSLKNILHRAKVILDSASTKVLLLHPKEQIRIAGQKVDSLDKRLILSTGNKISQLKTKIENLAWGLSSLDPKSVLNRGFAIIKKDNKVITKAALLSSGQNFTVVLKDGNVEGTVNGKK